MTRRDDQPEPAPADVEPTATPWAHVPHDSDDDRPFPEVCEDAVDRAIHAILEAAHARLVDRKTADGSDSPPPPQST